MFWFGNSLKNMFSVSGYMLIVTKVYITMTQTTNKNYNLVD